MWDEAHVTRSILQHWRDAHRKKSIEGGLNLISKLYGKDVDETQEGSITETNFSLSFLLIC